MAEIIEIKNDLLSVGINTLGAELKYVNSKKGTEFIWISDECVWPLSAPVLFPICGGLKEDKYTYNGKEYVMEKHGFGQLLEYEGFKINDTKAEFILKSSEETKKSYPFDFELIITYELCENKLKVSNTVKNETDGDMYFSIGAHEGYYCPEGIEEYSIEFEEPQTLESYILNGNLLEKNYIKVLENATKFPLKYDYFKVDALVFKNIKFNKATLVHEKSNKRVSVEFKDSNYFLLWTKPNAKYICLEPWNGIQDIVGSDYELTRKEGIEKLNKNETKTIVHTIEFFE